MFLLQNVSWNDSARCKWGVPSLCFSSEITYHSNGGNLANKLSNACWRFREHWGNVRNHFLAWSLGIFLLVCDWVVEELGIVDGESIGEVEVRKVKAIGGEGGGEAIHIMSGCLAMPGTCNIKVPGIATYIAGAANRAGNLDSVPNPNK